MQNNFFIRLSKLDKMLKKNPEDIDFKKDVEKFFLDETSKEYFFQKLENPAWIGLLQKAGCFKKTPEPVRDDLNKTISYPTWPELTYLKKMASRLPKKIMKILTNLPLTKNILIIDDIAEIITNLCKNEPVLAAKWAKKEAKWIIQKGLYLSYADEHGNLIVELAKNGQLDAAFNLAKALLDILPERTKAKEPGMRLNSWNYEEIIKKTVPVLVEENYAQAVDFLCSLLDKAVKYSKIGGHVKRPKDYSYIWRAVIADNSQDNLSFPQNILVTLLRDALLTTASKDTKSVTNLVEILEKYNWWIFTRLIMYLLETLPNVDKDLLGKYLASREFYVHYDFGNEYRPLLKKHFKHLSNENQRKILYWMLKGPEKELVEEWRERLKDEEKVKKQKYCYIRDRLSLISEHLTGKEKEYFKKLVSELGPPKAFEVKPYFKVGRVTRVEPKSVEELKSLTPDEIIDLINSLQKKEYNILEQEEYSINLVELIASEPDRFAKDSLKFNRLAPPYIREIIRGFEESIKQGKKFSWQHVLDLCKWSVDQHRDSKGTVNEEAKRDTGWGWVRREISSLLITGFKSDFVQIPIVLKTKSWEIIEVLTEDPQPTEKYEKEPQNQQFDPATIAINTVRGEAMHAVIEYALWRYRYLEKKPGWDKIKDRSFKKMPEVRRVLEKHLETDQSLAIRSIYGQYFPWLFLMDNQWAKENTEKIFPVQNRKFFNSAWYSYVTFCPPYNNVYEILKNQYSSCIDSLDESPEYAVSLLDPKERLVDHLITFYWRGIIDFDDKNGLLNIFYSKATLELKSHVILFIGRTLIGERKDIDETTKKRLMNLWERRSLAIKKDSQGIENIQELKDFGWWFSSRKFNDKWSLTQLKTAQEVSLDIGNKNGVIARLSDLSSEYPYEVIVCLELLAKNDKEGWGLHIAKDNIFKILKSVIRSDNVKAQSKARAFINWLGSKSRYFWNLRELL